MSITNRAYTLASIVSEKLLGGEHGWEKISSGRFNDLKKELREKLK